MPFQNRAIPEGLRSKKNVSGATILKGKLVKLDATTDDGIVPVAATTDAIYGVTLHDIADTVFGDVQTRGKAVAVAGAAITKGAQLMFGTGAKVITWSAGAGTNAAMAGLAERSAAADNDEIEVELSGPAVFKQG